MAFSFGASTSSTPAFGASSTPAFGASSGGFAFGASSAPAFGTPSSTPAFGASSTPAFGASSTPAFGASSTPAFGASSTPAFGAPSSTPAFGASSTPAFGASTGGFSFSTAAPGTTSLFGQPAASAPAFSFSQPQQAAAQQQPVAFTHATKFEELDKATQDTLLQIQAQVSKYEADRVKVTQLEHLQGFVQLPQGLDADTSGLSSELRGLLATIRAEQDSLADFREKEIRLLKATETVVRTFERTKLWRDATAMYQRQEPLKPAQQELLSQPVLLPGPFLEEAVAGFAANTAQYNRCLEEVEQVLAASSLAEQPPGGVNWVTALPTVVANLHDYFVAVAAKLERLHSEVARDKAAYLARLRARGITADPFERARRQEQQHLMLQQQQQQQRLAAAAGGGHAALAALPAAQGGAGTPGALVPAAASPQAGLFGSPQPGTPAAPGFGAPFGSPFVSATPAPFGATAAGLSRSASASKSRSGKKR